MADPVDKKTIGKPGKEYSPPCVMRMGDLRDGIGADCVPGSSANPGNCTTSGLSASLNCDNVGSPAGECVSASLLYIKYWGFFTSQNLPLL